MLKKLYRQVGLSRGGTSKTPSCLWLDEDELYKYTKNAIDKPKQIIGHTPTASGSISAMLTNASHINMDTFSLTNMLSLFGTGELLIYNYKTKGLTFIQTDYADAETLKRLKEIRK